MKTGPIIHVEDDIDDQEVVIDALKTLGIKNDIITLDNGQKALEFLKTTTVQPFLIISDVNLPLLNGLQFKQEIENNLFLKRKSIPFIFLSTSAASQAVTEAYDLSVQGFFIKANTYEDITQQLKQIIDYWSNCQHPNSER